MKSTFAIALFLAVTSFALPQQAPTAPKSILKPGTSPQVDQLLRPNSKPGGPETGLGGRQSGFRLPKGQQHDLARGNGARITIDESRNQVLEIPARKPKLHRQDAFDESSFPDPLSEGAETGFSAASQHDAAAVAAEGSHGGRGGSGEHGTVSEHEAVPITAHEG